MQFIAPGCNHMDSQEWKKILLNYFKNNPVDCKTCGNTFNFEGLIRYLDCKSLSLLGSVQLFGISSSFIFATIYPDKVLQISATELNIPA